MRIVITGAQGLLGWHAHARLHAANCEALYQNGDAPYDVVPLSHQDFDDDATLSNALTHADAVLHFAGVNRAPDDELETSNPAISQRLIERCSHVGVVPHIVFASSIHAGLDTPYGRSKKRAGELLCEFTKRYSELILPHIFGEGARPFYNNVTATLISNILSDREPTINPNGKVELMHAGAAVQVAIDCVTNGHSGHIAPRGRKIAVRDLYSKLLDFHQQYLANILPDLSDPFARDLFNTYRHPTYPGAWPRELKLNSDDRGTLFEGVKGGGGGQTFLSTTKPGVTRGDHFHLDKIERFLVLDGEGLIRIRKILQDEIWEFRVSGDRPSFVDMPVLHTHSIENVGSKPLLTLFWTHELFDPSNPGTFADKVLI